MNILEFIRKNSALVLIVIAGVGVGLLMMDYGGKGSMLSNDYYIQVDGTSYSDQEAINLGAYGANYIQEIASAVPKKLRSQFDTNEDEQLDETETASMQAWLATHPEVEESMAKMDTVLQAWSYGHTRDSKTNIAINRAIIQAEGKALGIYPSKEQIDAYIAGLPAFIKADGSFDQELYRRLSGFRNNMADNATEKIFRSVISDLIIWESLQNVLTQGMVVQAQAQTALINTQIQDMFGKTAWIDASNIPTIAPTAEESKEYWEKNKDNYLSDEKRIASVYTLTPGADSNIDELMTTAELLMQDIAQNPSAGIDQLLAEAAENPENPPFTYLTADGKSCVTTAAYTQKESPAELSAEIEDKNGLIALSQLAFDVGEAPSMESYQEALAAGKEGAGMTIKHLRGFYPTQDGKLVMVQVRAIEKPVVLSYEEAKEQSDADFTKDAHLADLTKKASELQDQMEEQSLEDAFKLAEEQKATIEDFGPISVEANANLLEGIDPAALTAVASGKFAPIYVSAEGARITAITNRSYTDSPDMAAFKTLRLLPMANTKLQQQILVDWLHNCYQKYDVKLAERASN